MNSVLALIIFSFVAHAFAAETAAPPVVCEPGTVAVAAKPVMVVKTVKKYKAKNVNLQKVIAQDLKSELNITGQSKFNNAGQAVVIVPVAKPNYISGVTADGKIVMIPIANAKMNIVGSELVASNAASAGVVSSANKVTKTTVTTTQNLNNSSHLAATSKGDLDLERELATETNSISNSNSNTNSNTNSSVSKTTVKTVRTSAANKMYAMGVLGVGAYPEVTNVGKSAAVNGALGFYLNDNVMIEAGLGVAKYAMSIKNNLFANQNDNFDVNQYQIFTGAKYRADFMGDTNFRPIAGAIVSYTYRNYNLKNGLAVGSSDTGNSSAFDAGLSGGVDYELTRAFTLGLDIKYMMNLSNQISSNFANPIYGYNGTQLEKFQHYVAGLSAKLDF